MKSRLSGARKRREARKMGTRGKKNEEESDKRSQKDYVSPTFLDSDFDKMNYVNPINPAVLIKNMI